MLAKTDTKIAPWYLVRSDDDKADGTPEHDRAHPVAGSVQEAVAQESQASRPIQERVGRRRKVDCRPAVDRPAIPMKAFAAAGLLAGVLLVDQCGCFASVQVAGRGTCRATIGWRRAGPVRPEASRSRPDPRAHRALSGYDFSRKCCSAPPNRQSRGAPPVDGRDPTLHGSDLQDAAGEVGVRSEFCRDGTLSVRRRRHGIADRVDDASRRGVRGRPLVGLCGIQRLRAKASQAGKLKTTPQQDVETRTTSGGEQVIVIEPSNPRVVYVPQLNPDGLRTINLSTVVMPGNDNDAAVAAGLIGFTAGSRLAPPSTTTTTTVRTDGSRRRVHVQRRVERLLRRARGRTRRLAGPSGGHARRARRPP